jgi:hypothetical protein
MADIRLRRRVFVFSVTTALVIGDQQKVSVIVPAAEVVAVLAAPALIRTLQVKAFASIQLAPTLSAIAGQGRGILEDLYPRPYTPGRPPAAPLPPRRRAVLRPYHQNARPDLNPHVHPLGVDAIRRRGACLVPAPRSVQWRL